MNDLLYELVSLHWIELVAWTWEGLFHIHFEKGLIIKF